MQDAGDKRTEQTISYVPTTASRSRFFSTYVALLTLVCRVLVSNMTCSVIVAQSGCVSYCGRRPDV